MNRRDFLINLALTALPPPSALSTLPLLSAPLTHSDWMLKPGMAWGEEGVRHMLDACKASGWSRVYWRALDSGRAAYRSRLLDPFGAPEADNIFRPARPEDGSWTRSLSAEKREELIGKMSAMDYAHFDTLAAAVRYGHQIGLEVHAWVSINEDDHGWGWPSRFAKAHPESRWRRRDGSSFHSQQSFAFSKVRAYKLAILEEIVRGYAVDGLFLDWIRTGDVRDNPQTDSDGVALYGYEIPLVDGFRKKYGVDPRTLANGDDRWVRWRAAPQTLFMRTVRKKVRSLRPNLPLTVMVSHPWSYRGFGDKKDGSLRGLLLDVTSWAREGLIDAAVAEGYYRDGGTPERACESLKAEMEGKVEVWYFGWVPTSVAGFHDDVSRATKLGAKQILYWEADYIDDRPNRQDLQRAMRGR